MAEERLIDDDKDRKYKIRRNADGEEELVIDDTPDDDDESDIPVFEIPVYEEDDEEAAVLTPEQLAERERLKKQEEAARAEKLDSLLAKTKEKLAEGDFESALYLVSQATELSDNSGEAYCLKLKILSRNFTDFLSLEKCAEAAEGVSEYADQTQKAELKELAAGLKERISQVKENTAKLSEENENAKAERREFFAKNKQRALSHLFLTAGPFLVFLLAAISFGSVIFANENGAFLIVTIVLAALALIMFVCTIFTLKKFWAEARNVKLNEKDTTTKLGREYLENANELELLNKIYSSFDNDIS